MSPEDISRAFVACVGFRWQVGMVSEQRGLVVVVVGGEPLSWFDMLGGGLIDDGDLDERPTPDTSHGPTLDIIAGTLLRAAWPGHSVQVETFDGGTATVQVFKDPSWPNTPPVFTVSTLPVAVSLLRCLQAAPGEAAP